MRKFLPAPEGPENNSQGITQTLRTGKPTAGYARRSDHLAKDKEKDKSQSREMQTEDLKKWAIGQGWKEEDFHPYFADLGLSGTLRPDQRPDMLRLFDDIDAGMFDHSSVICYQENRLFRDETQIYYNQFIQKCKDHDVVVVVVSPYLMIYDFRDDFLTEMFRWKCKEAADFIKRHVKGWMHPARERAAKQGRYAGMSDIPMGYIVDYEPTSPTFRKYIPYEPHSAVIIWLFQRFMELCGDLNKLYRELADHPVYFPPFTQDVDRRNISKRKLKLSAAGYRIRTRTAVESILTNPVYIGYWTVKGIVVKKDNHQPIVDFDTFMFAFNRVSKYTLEGELREEEAKPRRFYQRDTEAYLALLQEYPPLLKDRVTSSSGFIHVNVDRRYGRNGVKYMFIAADREEWFYNRGFMELGKVEQLDALVVGRLFEHVHQLGDMKPYNEQLAQKRAERQRKLKSVEESIKQIDVEQVNITRRIARTNSPRMQELYEEQIVELENERQALLEARENLLAESDITLRSLEEELSDLEANWPGYPTDRKIALINFLVKEVVVDVMSPHWTRVQVLWLHSDWGREEMYVFGQRRGAVAWTAEEDAILKEHYPATRKGELLKLLPRRNWFSINKRSTSFGLSRGGGAAGIKLAGGDQDIANCFLDREFLGEKGIPVTCSRTKWTPVYQLA
jgi:hypothetical protein